MICVDIDWKYTYRSIRQLSQRIACSLVTFKRLERFPIRPCGVALRSFNRDDLAATGFLPKILGANRDCGASGAGISLNPT